MIFSRPSSAKMNRLQNRLVRCAAVLLTAACLAQTVSAAVARDSLKLIGSANLRTRFSLDSTVSTGATLTAEEAAERLYTLGMLSGSGINQNGGVDFALDQGLRRVDSAVLAVRLLGLESKAVAEHAAHPFTDVPVWASDYVGCLYQAGLLNDLIPKDGSEARFYPDTAESSDRFMSYMLHALGYRIAAGDYTVLMAGEYARGIGITAVEKDEPLTRGDAVLAMYNTLRTTMKNSRRVYSESLVEKGVVSYEDAVFLLWSRDRQETETYLRAVGREVQWVIPDGFYTIKLSGSSQVLNVATSGMNDYEGVPVTLWKETGDVSQVFRIERTARGTYTLYGAASRNGYGRVVGCYTGSVNTCLTSATYRSAMEFYIKGSVDGTWTIVSASDPNLCLSAADPEHLGQRVTLAQTGSEPGQSWEFSRMGVMNAAGEELAIFVADSLRITQGRFDEFSHRTQNAIDFAPTNENAYAPFNAKIVRIDDTEQGCNAVWLESVSPVRYADGTYDYMTAVFMHDDNIENLSVGMGLKQGEIFYQSGSYGNADGIHIHLALYRGQYRSDMRLGSGDLNAEDGLFLKDDTLIYDDYGLSWKRVSEAN